MRGPTVKILFFCVCLFLLTGESFAQKDQGVLIDLHRQGSRRVRLTLLSLEIESGEATVASQGAALACRLVRDFAYSGVLEVVGSLPEGVTLPPTTPAASTEEEPKPDAVVGLSLSGEDPTGMVLTARLLAPGAQTLIVGKRYVVDLKDPGPAVHHFCDVVVNRLTGEAGIARTRILFSRGNREKREIFLVDYDGENLKQVTRNGSINLAPCWSPDSNRACYTSYYQGRQRLLILDGKTGRSERVSDFPGLNVGASWDPRSGGLVVTLSRDGNAEIYRIDGKGGIVQRLTHGPSIECSPDFDPTGQQVVFTSDRTGRPQIYVMDREGANRRRLSYEGDYNDSADWSPRGDRIAYVCRIAGRFQVFTIEPDGSNLQQITFSQDGNNEDPSWAPDGRHLVVSSDRSGQTSLWVLDVEGGTARRLTSGAEDDTCPDWSGTDNPAVPSGNSDS